MELKHYLRIVVRRWKIVLGVTIATVLFTLAFVSGQSDTYESSGTWVVRPREGESGEVVRATDALNRGVEINSTYARIARSDVIKGRAKEDLITDGVPTSGLSVVAQVVPGTNIIEIGAKGHDPAAVTAYAAAVGNQTALYLDETGEVFQLQLLDAPDEPKNPLPTRNNITLVLGGFLGLMAGAVLAFSAEYFGESTERRGVGIYDEPTGAYSNEFLKLRFRQEMSRCDLPATTKARWRVRTNSFTFALMRVSRPSSSNGADPDPRPADLRDAAQALMPHLRPEDVLAYVGEDSFAAIFPDMPADPAAQLLDEWGQSLSAREHNGSGAGSALQVAIGVCDVRAEGLEGDEEAVQYARAMRSDAT